MGVGFIPSGAIATFAQMTSLGRAKTGTRKRRRKRSTRASKRTRAATGTRKTRSSRGKPRPGTKAWMAYIRGMRGKKKRK